MLFSSLIPPFPQLQSKVQVFFLCYGWACWLQLLLLPQSVGNGGSSRHSSCPSGEALVAKDAMKHFSHTQPTQSWTMWHRSTKHLFLTTYSWAMVFASAVYLELNSHINEKHALALLQCTYGVMTYSCNKRKHHNRGFLPCFRNPQMTVSCG